jgi:farnesyl diphosphate synthase
MVWNEVFQRDFEGFFRSRTHGENRLTEAILYALKSPGKRLRPKFAEEAGGLAGLDPQATRYFSYAIELVHLFSLIHDDLPCMDDDDFRRGQATVHKKFDEATALLAGDALLNFAFEAFSECAAFVEKDAFVSALKFFTNAIGTEGMIGGQSKELELGNSVDEKSLLVNLLAIQDLKTGALFRAALSIPFLLAGVPTSDSLHQEVHAYASDFGFAFQIADDLEDEAQDQVEQTKNILSILGRDAAKKMALERLSRTSVAEKFTATALLIKKLTS